MTESLVRATRAIVQIGSLTVDGFMLPDGSYGIDVKENSGGEDEPS